MPIGQAVLFRAICTKQTHIYVSAPGGFAALRRTEKNRIYDMVGAVTLHGTPCFLLPAEPGDPSEMARVVIASCFRRIEPRKTDIESLRALLPSPKGRAA